MKHRFVLDNNGNIDEFAFESGYCNGPTCTRCNMSWCEHCESFYRGKNIYTEECPGDRFQQAGQLSLFSEDVA